MNSPQRGAAAVEMAVMLLFLLPLLLGLVDVGRLIYAHIAVQEAAQEGALLASFEEGVTVAEVKNRVISSTSFPTILPGEITVQCGTDTGRTDPGTWVTVTVTHTHDMLLPFTGSATLAKTAATDRFFGTCPT